MIIINLYVSQELHDFYKPIARLIIKIFMIAITNFENRLTNGFHDITVYWGKQNGKTGHSKIFTFLRHFLIILKRDFSRASILHHITDTDNT